MTLKDVTVNSKWDFNRVFTLILDEFKQELLRIEPVVVQNREDAWTWESSPTGKYRTKDAYDWLYARTREHGVMRNWAWIWKLGVPEKIRYFIWIMMHESLQVNQYCFSCNLAGSPACPRCSCDQESILHCLRDCPYAFEIWNRMGALSWQGFGNTNLECWLRNLALSSNGITFIATVWGIWKWRNNVVFEPPGWNIDEAWRRICMEHDEIVRFGNLNGMEHDTERLRKAWCCPPEGKTKLNVDGSFLPLNECMGGGGALRDSKGTWITGFQYHEAGGNILRAEALALKHGLDLAWHKGYRTLVCEVDCKELLEALEDEESVRLLEVLQEIRECLKKQWFVELEWIPRDCNKVADCLAYQGAISSLPGLQFFEEPPIDVQNLLLSDSWFCS